MTTYHLRVNGREHAVDTDPDTPLLYVLRNELQLNGAKFGCGLGQCGACTVTLDGAAVMSCLVPVSVVGTRPVGTVEGHAGGHAEARVTAVLEQAFVAEQAAQCGYCIAGMIMRAASLLAHNAAPTDGQIRTHMMPNLCRCGTHMRILRAVRRAADTLGGGKGNANGNGNGNGRAAAGGSKA